MYSHKTQYYSNNSSNNIPFSVSRAAATTTTSPSGVTIPIQPDYFTELLDSSLLQDYTLSQLNNNNSSCSSGYSSYVGSPASSSTPNYLMMQRSVSSHSLLHLHNNKSGTHHQYYHPFSALFAELLDSSSSSSEDTPAVRRVYSAGDLQGIKGMQHHHHHHVDSSLSSESSMIIEGMSRVCPYSPEEKKIRIERYKIKRNQRNFNKKIKYACRKTLADRRPRIRGRFARNHEIDDQKNSSTSRVDDDDDEWSHDHIGGMEEEVDQEADEENNWFNIFDSIVVADSHTSSTFGLLY